MLHGDDLCKFKIVYKFGDSRSVGLTPEITILEIVTFRTVAKKAFWAKYLGKYWSGLDQTVSVPRFIDANDKSDICFEVS